MDVSIFGLGYVGAVTAGCLAARGHRIVGVDVAATKVHDLNRGIPPIIEPGLDALLSTAIASGKLRATTDAADAVRDTRASLVCVGTPSTVSGALDLTYVRQVTREIVAAAATKAEPHTLVFRSTMLPGSTRTLVRECAAEAVDSGRLRVYYYPEFLREGTAVKDFDEPSLVAVGTHDGTPPRDDCRALFGHDAETVSWESAELLKYACNAFHATKVAFANEIGRLGKALGLDAATVMRLLCRDSRLNISPYYLRPGNPFGGSCLPKDVRALVHHARQTGASLPLVEGLLPSNERHLQSLLEIVAASGEREIVVLGLSFKPNTDDLRESAMVEVAQHCLGRGFAVRIFDPQLNLAALVGANKRVIDTRMPHLASLLQPDLRSAVGQRGLLVVSQKCVGLSDLAAIVTPRHRILDVNGWPELRELPAPYQGLCW
ncbi:MAG: UDP-glucose/GDP-mannose dehydrogenase family protein [Verrucomicrobiales bacterium]|nr:UDP-glucose/GDP-mannose dehydrogenase family protein [Verrucomicrobiales bacterium]